MYTFISMCILICIHLYIEMYTYVILNDCCSDDRVISSKSIESKKKSFSYSFCMLQ